VPGGRVARGRPQRAERGVEAPRDLRRRQQGATGGGELDGQRETVHAAADVGHGGGVPVREIQLRVVRACAHGEQRRGVVGRQGRHGPAFLGLQGEWLAARRQDGHARAGLEHATQERSEAEHVLAVVHDQEQVPAREEALDGLLRGLAVEQGGAERSDDRHRDILRAPLGSERHEARAVGEAGLGTTRGVDREACLADAARPGEGQQPGGVQARGDPGQLGYTADRAVGQRGETAGGSCGHRRGEPGVVGEDLRVELGELGSGLDPELLDEHLARPAVGLQRIGLAPAAIEREHQLRVQLLAPRMLAGQLPQIGDELGVTPGGEARLHAQLDGLEPLLLQPREPDGGERQRPEVAQWRPPPE
jgi:hypothetical protein